MREEILIEIGSDGNFHRTVTIPTKQINTTENTSLGEHQVPKVMWSKELSSFTVNGKPRSYEEVILTLRQLQRLIPKLDDI